MLKSKFPPILIGAAALFAAGLLAAAPAEAVSFDLTSCHISNAANTGLACPPAGTVFGTVMLTQNGLSDGTGSVAFDVSLSDSNRFLLTGSADNQYFKFNATGVGVGDITVTQNVANVHLIADTGALNGDGTGNFSFGITCDTGTGCGTGGSNALPVGTTIDFTVANSAISDFTNLNNFGNLFVADIICGATFPGCAGLTGPVDAVPAPVIGHGLFVLLAIGGVLSGSRLLERSKKRSSLATATPHAA